MLEELVVPVRFLQKLPINPVSWVKMRCRWKTRLTNVDNCYKFEPASLLDGSYRAKKRKQIPFFSRPPHRCQNQKYTFGGRGTTQYVLIGTNLSPLTQLYRKEKRKKNSPSLPPLVDESALSVRDALNVTSVLLLTKTHTFFCP